MKIGWLRFIASALIEPRSRSCLASVISIIRDKMPNFVVDRLVNHRHQKGSIVFAFAVVSSTRINRRFNQIKSNLNRI